MRLRPYQSEIVRQAREALRQHRSAMVQLGTGGGKTVIFSHITESAFGRRKRVWEVVPRNELLRQSSEELLAFKVPHAMIAAGKQESRAYRIHVVSLETLKRRLKAGKIINPPDLMIIDEAHIQLDGQKLLFESFPDTKILGFTATPERLDGRGLGKTEIAGTVQGLYDSLIEGPSIRDMIEMGYLSPMRYFCPPIPGLDTVHRKGTEYDANELDALFQKRAVYGKAIDHYRKYADRRPALVYCRSVKAAEETATRFREAGYRFESIDGRMSDKKRKSLIDGLKDGRLHGLTSCELVTYGLNVPRVEVIIMLRPTLSKALYMQMIGRGLRTYPDKESCLVLDHVGNLREHGHPLQDQHWQFWGVLKKKRAKGESAAVMKLCPKCFLYYEGTGSCPNCGESAEAKKRKDLEEVDGRLVEIKGPVALKDRPYEERREFEDRIAADKAAFAEAQERGEIDYGPIEDLCKVADELGRSVMWVYHSLNAMEYAVNVPLLTAIKDVKGYKNGWVWFKRKELQSRAS
jgi:DNA repair protein RadD